LASHHDSCARALAGGVDNDQVEVEQSSDVGYTCQQERDEQEEERELEQRLPSQPRALMPHRGLQSVPALGLSTVDAHADCSSSHAESCAPRHAVIKRPAIFPYSSDLGHTVSEHFT
jgi:hypothetical protein